MQFNSLQYAFFLIIVFFVFWFLLRNNLRLQNIFLLAASYIFYSWWDWRFLTLIIFLSSVNYIVGILLGKYDPDTEERKRKFILLLVIFINLGLLGIFKYFNFFAESAVELFNAVGFKADKVTLNVILPIGISFYTFQTLGYTIDIYRTKYKPTKDIIAFFSFVSFFPLLLAGPIERGDTLLPQFFKKKEFEYNQAVNGMRQILWGLFKKLVVADRVAIYVDAVYNNIEHHSGITFIVATLFYAFQIYCDFSGYSDIAIGSARLLGFNLTTNFRNPYFSRNVAEFWRRWHISLSNWLRDYLFIPLNVQFRNLRIWGGIIAVLITFLLCGLWHGANWTFIIWGGIQGLYLAFNITISKFRNKQLSANNFTFVKDGGKILLTFILVSFSWIFFRANTVTDAFHIVNKIINISGPLFIPQGDDVVTPIYAIIAITILVVSEFKFEFFSGKYSFMNNSNIIIRYSAYLFLLFLIILTGVLGGSQFIYFQF